MPFFKALLQGAFDHTMESQSLTPIQRAVLDLAGQLRRKTAAHISAYLKTYLDTPHQVNQINANAIRYAQINRNNFESIQQYFWQQIQIFDSVSGMNWGDNTGKYIGITLLADHTPTLEIKTPTTGVNKYIYALDDCGNSTFEPIGLCPNYDPRHRLWYQTAQQFNCATWSPIYQYSNTIQVQLGLMAVLPLYDAKNCFMGVLGCDLSLSHIGEFLKTLTVDQGSIAFIVEPCGTLVASSSVTHPLTVDPTQTATCLKAIHSSDRLIQATTLYLYQHFENLAEINTDHQLEFTWNQEIQLIDVFPFNDSRGLNWLIVLVTPESKFLQKIPPDYHHTSSQAQATLERINQNLEQRIQPRSSSLKQLDEALKSSEDRWKLALQGSNDGIWDWNVQTNELFFSPRAKEMLGYEDHEINNHLAEWEKQIHPEDRERVLKAIEDHLDQKNHNYSTEYRIRCKDGSYKWVLHRGQALWNDQGDPIRMVGSQTDLSQQQAALRERKQAEAKLFYFAYHDSLTRLPNRAFFMDKLQLTLNQARQHSDHLFAVLFIDLDRFKLVNDGLGHLAGDELLIRVGQKLQHCIKSNDTLARLGGDEFAILLDKIQGISDSILVAELILATLQEPFLLEEQSVSISASIGITLSHYYASNHSYKHSTDILRDADLAMYHAKHHSSLRYAIFDSKMQMNTLMRLRLENDLRAAIESSKLKVYYQPIVCFKTGKIKSFEALVRLPDPKKGLISPGEFIPIAEETGLIVPLGEWVLRAACQQLRQWQIQEGLDPNISVSVNVAGQQFSQKKIVRQVQQILQETELTPANLRLEITESAIAEHLEWVAKRLTQLQQMGIQILIDDFGTGYSSLDRLQRFPIDTLKIDRSFVSQMTSPNSNSKFVEAIANFAHSLGFSIVAEGIETLEQKQIIQQIGCEYGQGNLFSAAVDAATMTAFIQRHPIF
ncbi:EAL domain-containing protein [Limnoraphis robusta Tam1]|uniref:EAL domain-containing protein n=1 Tax=Limnoraphis robusta TaxID=1118279 RepID=UPI002B21A470|nr:EAL domain-containing protein [Limnoraphis robusta]MEA5540826.1 EAL domain-containing protein [Limnoraphis robusta Tam1]